MMKKFFYALFVLSFVLVLAACKGDKVEIALITDAGTINDKSFNQGSWEGVKAYAKKHGISHDYFQPDEVNTESYLATIELAVKAGAKVIVTPGFYFSEAIGEAQTKYPDVTFILVDATPTVDGKEEIKDNVIPILFNEQQSGFLAGYAAVKDGFRKLGFMGGNPVPAVRNFGYGYVQGANYAAQELNLEEKITIRYHYLGDFVEKPEFKTKAEGWYQSGTEVIFAAAGGAGNSVMSAAQTFMENNQPTKFVIGVDVDQSHESKTVITSALKELANAVEYALENRDKLGGEVLYLDILNDGVGLPTDFSRMRNFTKEDYEQIVNKLKTDKTFREGIKGLNELSALIEKDEISEADLIAKLQEFVDKVEIQLE